MVGGTREDTETLGRREKSGMDSTGVRSEKKTLLVCFLSGFVKRQSLNQGTATSDLNLLAEQLL